MILQQLRLNSHKMRRTIGYELVYCHSWQRQLFLCFPYNQLSLALKKGSCYFPKPVNHPLVAGGISIVLCIETLEYGLSRAVKEPQNSFSEIKIKQTKFVLQSTLGTLSFFRSP